MKYLRTTPLLWNFLTCVSTAFKAEFIFKYLMALRTEKLLFNQTGRES